MVDSQVGTEIKTEYVVERRGGNGVTRFGRNFIQHQIQWARLAGKSNFLERKPSWVLQHRLRQENLFDPSWMKLIHGREHRWFRALNSSQAFAVNLLGL